MISWTWPPGYGCETVGNTLIKHVCDLFWNPVDIGRRSGHFNKSSWINLGHARVLGIECGQLKNELLGASHRRSCRFLYQNDPERFFFWGGSFGFTLPVPQMGRLWGYGVHLFIHFFVHEFLLSFVNSSVFKSKHMCRKKCLSTKHYLRKIVCQQGRPLFIFWHHAIAVGIGSVVHSIGSMWRNDLWRRSHQRHLEPRQHPRQKIVFVVQSKCGKTVSRWCLERLMTQLAVDCRWWVHVCNRRSERLTHIQPCCFWMFQLGICHVSQWENMHNSCREPS